jgi:uncharacterized membrane protein YkvA (DUF1232 family)
MEENYSKHYSEKSFWDKVKKYAKQIGNKTLHSALVLYYVGLDNQTPKWAKGVILASLGYLIFPFDAIPDITPFAGYADDAGAIASALAVIAGSITIEHKNKADQKIVEWFDNSMV